MQDSGSPIVLMSAFELNLQNLSSGEPAIMMRRILSFPVFCLCLVAGLLAAPLAFENQKNASGFNITPATNASGINTPVNTRARRSDKMIEVAFDGFTEIDGNLNSNFVIANFSDEPFLFSAYEAPAGGWAGNLHFSLELNGKMQGLGWCGTGLKQFELSPGESIRTSVPMSHVAQFWKRGDKIRIGYYLHQRDGKSTSEPYWSDAVPMTPEIERYLEREKSR